MYDDVHAEHEDMEEARTFLMEITGCKYTGALHTHAIVCNADTIISLARYLRKIKNGV